MELGLSWKTALVTGASSGLGLAAATALGREGASLVICSRSGDKLKHAAERIHSDSGATTEIIAADLSTPDGLMAVERVIADRAIDILVSNAGGPPPGQFLDHAAEAWSEANDLVLQLAIALSRMILPGMIERKWGRLIYVTSVGVLQPIDDLILSNTYRAGVTGFCKTISNNYASYGVTANCVCPGYTATERLTSLVAQRAEATGQSEEEVTAGFTGQIPAQRFGKPEELAAMIAFLASERAGYISGTSIPVDGGYHRSLL